MILYEKDPQLQWSRVQAEKRNAHSHHLGPPSQQHLPPGLDPGRVHWSIRLTQRCQSKTRVCVWLTGAAALKMSRGGRHQRSCNACVDDGTR